MTTNTQISQRFDKYSLHDEPIQAYLLQMRETPLLRPDEELQMSLAMQLAKNRFRTGLLACQPVLAAIIDLLHRIRLRELRLDRYVDVCVTKLTEKRRVRASLLPILRELRSITHKNQRDFRIAIARSVATSDRRRAWRRVVRRKYRAAKLIEQINLRSAILSSLLSKVRANCEEMRCLRCSLRRAVDNREPSQVVLLLRKKLLHAMLTNLDSPETLKRRLRIIDKHRLEYGKLRRGFAASNLRFVVSIARRYRHTGLPLSDLIQEGNVGLMRAIEKFDPQRGYRFTTYADRWIRQQICQAVSRTSNTIVVPLAVNVTLREFRRSVARLVQAFGRQPQPEEIASSIGMTTTRVEQMIRLAKDPLSLDQRINGGQGNVLLDLLETNDGGEDFRSQDDQTLIHERVLKVMEVLNAREREILRLRFGLEDGVERTLVEIGKKFCLSRERIRQIESRAVQKLQEPAMQLSLADFMTDG